MKAIPIDLGALRSEAARLNPDTLSFARLFSILLLGWGLAVGAASAETATNRIAVPSTNQCAAFTLEDQFGSAHEFKFPRTKPTVLAVADKNGADHIKDWVHPLAERFGAAIEIAGLADVSTVPRPLRSLVRSKFKKAITYPVMLDWHGDATRNFGYDKGEANLFLISPGGNVLQHFSGKATPEKLKALESRIAAQLPESAQAKARSN